MTSAEKIRDLIFDLDMPVEELQPRQTMILKKQVLCILKDWQSEWDGKTQTEIKAAMKDIMQW